MLAGLSMSWGLLFLPTNLQKSTLNEDRPILLICSSPATSFIAVAFHPSTLHSLTHCCLTMIWNHIKQKYLWGIKRNYEVKSEKTWKGMSCLNFIPLFCTILFPLVSSAFQRNTYHLIFLSHYHTLIIPWFTSRFTTSSPFGAYTKALERGDTYSTSNFRDYLESCITIWQSSKSLKETHINGHFRKNF